MKAFLLGLVLAGTLAASADVGVGGYKVVTSCGSLAGYQASPYIAGRNAYATVDVNGQTCGAVVTAPSAPAPTCVSFNDSSSVDTVVKALLTNHITVVNYALVASDTVTITWTGGATILEGPMRFEGSKGEGIVEGGGGGFYLQTATDSGLILKLSRSNAAPVGGHFCYLLN